MVVLSAQQMDIVSAHTLTLLVFMLITWSVQHAETLCTDAELLNEQRLLLVLLRFKPAVNAPFLSSAAFTGRNRAQQRCRKLYGNVTNGLKASRMYRPQQHPLLPQHP